MRRAVAGFSSAMISSGISKLVGPFLFAEQWEHRSNHAVVAASIVIAFTGTYLVCVTAREEWTRSWVPFVLAPGIVNLISDFADGALYAPYSSAVLSVLLVGTVLGVPSYAGWLVGRRYPIRSEVVVDRAEV